MNAVRRLVASLSASKLADVLISVKVTLPALMIAIGAPAWMLGLLVPVRESTALLPQSAISMYLNRVPRRHRAWRLGMLGQAFAVLGMLVVSLSFSGLWGGALLLLLLLIMSASRAICSLTSKDIQADIADKGERGKLIGIAGTWAGAISLLCALPLLLWQDSLQGWKLNALVGLAGLCFVTALIVLWPQRTVVDISGSKQDGASKWLPKHPVVWRFLLVRGLFINSALAAPYFMLHSQHSATELLPVFFTVQASANLVSSAMWGRLADYSARITFAFAGGLAALACVLMALIESPELFTSGLLFLILALAHAGVRTARKTYALDVVTGNDRTRLVALSNTIIGVLLLLVGGVYSYFTAAQNSMVLLLVMAALLIVATGLSFWLPAEKTRR